MRFTPRIQGNIPLRKIGRGGNFDPSAIRDALQGLQGFVQDIPGMNDGKIQGLRGQLETQMRGQDYAMPEPRQTPPNASLAAAGMGLLLNMLDSKRQAGGGFAEGFLQAEKAKRDAEYQTAAQKLEERKRKDENELQITFMRLKEEEAKKKQLQDAFAETIKARRDHLQTLAEIEARGKADTERGTEITNRSTEQQLLTGLRSSGNPALRGIFAKRLRALFPEKYGEFTDDQIAAMEGLDIKEQNTVSQTKERDALLPGKLAKIKAEIDKIATDTGLSAARKAEIEQKVKFYPEEHRTKIAKMYADIAKGERAGSSKDAKESVLRKRQIVVDLDKLIKANENIAKDLAEKLTSSIMPSPAILKQLEQISGETKILQQRRDALLRETTGEMAGADGYTVDPGTGLRFKVKSG